MQWSRTRTCDENDRWRKLHGCWLAGGHCNGLISKMSNKFYNLFVGYYLVSLSYALTPLKSNTASSIGGGNKQPLPFHISFKHCTTNIIQSLSHVFDSSTWLYKKRLHAILSRPYLSSVLKLNIWLHILLFLRSMHQQPHIRATDC